jgi:hypothetical protein
MDTLDCTVLETSKYKITVATDITPETFEHISCLDIVTQHLKFRLQGIIELLQKQPLLGNAKHRSPVATDVHMY